jgi:hypothetical protein
MEPEGPRVFAEAAGLGENADGGVLVGVLNNPGDPEQAPATLEIRRPVVFGASFLNEVPKTIVLFPGLRIAAAADVEAAKAAQESVPEGEIVALPKTEAA